jgi:hypothetical protein
MNAPLETSVEDARATLARIGSDCSLECAERIRRAPLASVLGAAAFGYFLQFLPLRQIAAGLVRVTLGLARPALIVCGLLKLACCLKSCRSCENGDTGREPLIDSPAGSPPP